MMMWPGLPVSAAQRPAKVDVVLCRVRHPSFAPELADGLVRGLTRRQLRRIWAATTGMLGMPLSGALRLNVVVLREHALRELERHDPAAVRTCTRSDRSVLTRGRAGRA
jgi:hypothetical protein